jgi:hypothetical protein
MVPKEKAIKLVDKYWNVKVYTFHVKESIMSKELAVKCALIAQKNLLDKLKSLNIKDEYEEKVLSEINAL